MNFRIGEGWDTHALVAGRKLIIGGSRDWHVVSGSQRGADLPSMLIKGVLGL